MLHVSEPGGAIDLKAQLHGLRHSLASTLLDEVRGMNFDNFLVRPKRRLVEKYSEEDAWSRLEIAERTELKEQLAGLPSDVVDDDLAAKQFDLLIVRTQLAILESDPIFTSLREPDLRARGPFGGAE